jgi:uncharacterized Zn-binding protein involved in type VI secretion
MAILVCTGAGLMCPFGTAPSNLIVTSNTMVLSGAPAATIMDNAGFTNIPPFAMCTSLANPTVASATAAALGVLTPMPCTPTTPAPWAPGSSTVLIGGKPALSNNSQLVCAYGGTIMITSPGQTTDMVP